MATTITYKDSDLTSFSNTSKTLRTAGKYLEGDITITAGLDVNNQNKTVIPSETTQSITADSGYSGLGTVTVNGITNTYVGSSVPRPGSSGISNSITNGYYKISVSPGYYPGTANKLLGLQNPTIIPSETEQVKRPISNNYYLESVTVAAITPTYVGSSVPTQAATTITPSSATQTITGQKYMTGDITVEPIPSQYIVPSGTLTINSNGTNDVTQYASVEVNVPSNTPTLQTKSAVPSTSTTLTITADTGYDGLSSVTVAAITTTSQAIPQVSINSETGLITATATQSEGYVEAGTKRGTLQLTTKATTTYSPSTSDQYIQAGTYLTGLVTIEGMTNGDNLTYGTTTTVTEALVTKSLLDALATTIKNKATSSTLPMTISAMQTAVQSIRTSSQISLQSKTVNPNGSTVVITPDSGYDGLASVQVNAVNATELNVSSNGTYTPASGQYYNRVVVATDSQAEFNLQTKQVTPTTSPQSVTPDEGYNGLSSVTVQGIPSNYADITNVTAEVGDVLSGETFVDSTGASKTGTLVVNSYYVLSEIPSSDLGQDGDLCLKI